jgi:hypothetical protein
VPETVSADQPLDALVDLFLQVEALSDGGARDRAVDETAVALRREYTTLRTPDAQSDLLSLIHSYDLLTGTLEHITEAPPI